MAKLCRGVCRSPAGIRSQAVMITRMLTSIYGRDQRYCSRNSDDMTRKIDRNSNTNWSRRLRVSRSLSAAMIVSRAEPGPTPLIEE
ncbi:MAG: hypothetical protein P8X94_01900 [Woeseiaceae bacterium]